MQIRPLQLSNSYFWLKVKYSWMYKVLIVLVALFSFSVLFYFFSNSSNLFMPVPKYEFMPTIISLVTQPDKTSTVFIPDVDESICYWLTPSFKNGKFAMQVEESYSLTKDCYGDVLSTYFIPMDRPVSVYGNSSCICGGKAVELKKQLSEGSLSIEVIRNE